MTKIIEKKLITYTHKKTVIRSVVFAIDLINRYLRKDTIFLE